MKYLNLIAIAVVLTLGCASEFSSEAPLGSDTDASTTEPPRSPTQSKRDQESPTQAKATLVMGISLPPLKEDPTVQKTHPKTMT